MNKTSVPQDVTRQREANDAIYADLDKLAAEAEKAEVGNPGAPAPDVDLQAPPATLEPGTPEITPAPEATEEIAILRKNVDQLTKALSDLQAVLDDENRDTWKQKFLVMDGKFKHEIQPAAQKIKDLTEENDRLKTELAAKGKVAPSDSPENLDEEDKQLVDEMGITPALYLQLKKKLGVAAKAPEAPAAPAKTAEPAAAEEEHSVDSSAALQTYNTLLDVKSAGWRDTVNNPDFAQFLSTVRESIGGKPGRTLREVLVDADARFDADTVSRIYLAFAKRAPKAAEPSRPSREAAPASSKGGSSTLEAKSWTPEEIQQFNSDVAQGKIKRGSDEFKKVKASIDNFLENMRIT